MESAMRSFVLALSLTFAAFPAVAGMVTFDLPNLTWPDEDQTTTSTKGCETAPRGDSAACN